MPLRLDVAERPSPPSGPRRGAAACLPRLTRVPREQVVLAFDRIFWGAAAPRGRYIGYAAERKGEYYMFIDVTECAGRPTLLALVSGTVAQELEAREDEATVAEAMAVRAPRVRRCERARGTLRARGAAGGRRGRG